MRSFMMLLCSSPCSMLILRMILLYMKCKQQRYDARLVYGSSVEIQRYQTFQRSQTLQACKTLKLSLLTAMLVQICWSLYWDIIIKLRSDTCYYNYLCLYPWEPFYDNEVFFFLISMINMKNFLLYADLCMGYLSNSCYIADMVKLPSADPSNSNSIHNRNIDGANPDHVTQYHKLLEIKYHKPRRSSRSHTQLQPNPLSDIKLDVSKAHKEHFTIPSLYHVRVRVISHTSHCNGL